MPFLLMVGVLAGLLSVCATGFVFGYSNNVFHLPIVGSLYDLPQFSDDAFVQSLRRFSSGLWLMLEGSDRYVSPPSLFLFLFVVSRAISLVALLLIVREFNLRSRRAVLIAALLLAVSPIIRGQAYAGQGGLFIDYFSHSELATGITLLMWFALIRKQVGWAIAANGVVLFLNGFIAIWNGVPLLVAIVILARRGQLSDRRALTGIAAGVIAAIAVSLPVVLSALHAGALDTAALDFDYRAFLADYYPYHFLPWSTTPVQWAGLAAVLATAVLGLAWAAAPASRMGLLILCCYIVIYVAGIALPYVSGARGLLNLHLLRVSVMFHFLAAIGWSVTTVTLFLSGKPRDRFVLAPLMVLCGASLPSMLAGIPVLMLVRRMTRHRPPPAYAKPWFAIAALLACAGCLGILQLRVYHELQRVDRSVSDWEAVALSIKAHSEDRADSTTVLIPISANELADVDDGSAVFSYYAKRKVWVDMKAGAAVMWQPSFHDRWNQRRLEVMALKDWPQRIAYAQAHRIDFIVGDCNGLPPEANVVARTPSLCAMEVK